MLIVLASQSIVFAEPDRPPTQSVFGSPLVALALGAFCLVAVFVGMIVVLKRLRPKGAPPGLAYHPGFDRMGGRDLELYAMGLMPRAGATPTANRAVSPPARVNPAEGPGSGTPYVGLVYCPACTTQLAAAGPTLQYVTRCPGCARWLAAKSEGSRLTVEVREG